MSNSRITAFSDGVIAILITIMVLELHRPDGYTWAALSKVSFEFLIYMISFFVLGIYWNNHHHMFHLVHKVNGTILWWNLILLFTMSLIPFTTAWLGAYPERQVPELVFGISFFLVDLAFDFLAIEVHKNQNHVTSKFQNSRWFSKMIWSAAVLALGLLICLIFNIPYLVMIAVVVSLLPWLRPDREIEETMNHVSK